MAKLPPPIKRYLMGAYPTHAPTTRLHSYYKDLPQPLLYSMLQGAGYLSPDEKPLKKAAEDGLLDSCEGKSLWRVEAVNELLHSGGAKFERAAVNQEVELTSIGEPVFANLGTLGTYFSVSATQVGKWIDELGLREEGEPTKEALDAGLCTTVEMNAGGKKTRKVTQWEVNLMKLRLIEAGHVLDFNYEESLKGKGRNSDVKVGGMEARSREFAKEFARMYKDGSERKNTPRLVKATPSAIVKMGEELLKKPGFITGGEYLKNL